MLKSLGAVAVLLMTTSFASAAFDAQSVAAQLTAQGYTNIEIKVGQNVAEVEAIKDGMKIELIYDIASGAVIKSETGPAGEDDDNAPGTVAEDDNAGEDDGPGHDLNDDDTSGDDDDSSADDDQEDDSGEDDENDADP